MLLAISLHISHVPEHLENQGNVFVDLKLNSISYPGHNSGLPRQSRVVSTEPSLKFQSCIYLANIGLSASLVVLLSGDVSLNPGLVKDPCAVCLNGCRSNQKTVQCYECNKLYHTKCMNMGFDEYHSLVINESSTWMCFTCLFPGVNSLNYSSSSNLTLQHPEDFNDQPEICLL